VVTLTHLAKPAFMLGFIPNKDRVYLMDKLYNIISFELLYGVLAYQAAIVRGDTEQGPCGWGDIIAVCVLLLYQSLNFGER